MPINGEFNTKVKEALAPILGQFDPRFLHFDVRVKRQGETIHVTGSVHYPQMKSSAVHVLGKAFPGAKIRESLKVLTRDWPLRFATVEAPAVMGYSRPDGDPIEATTELLAGQVVRTFFRRKGWIYCQAPDGYMGWLPARSLRAVNRQWYLEWSTGRRWRLVNPWKGPGRREYRVGSEFPLTAQGRVRLPGKGLLRELPPGEVVDPDASALRARVVETARAYLGVPYLWGGRTDRGLDCSGFVQMIYARVGVALPRDANQQVNMGLLVGHLEEDFADLMPGDLVFFMSEETAKIFHVGISLGGDAFIHSESKGGVNEARFLTRKNQPAHNYTRRFCFGRRVLV